MTTYAELKQKEYNKIYRKNNKNKIVRQQKEYYLQNMVVLQNKSLENQIMFAENLKSHVELVKSLTKESNLRIAEYKKNSEKEKPKTSFWKRLFRFV